MRRLFAILSVLALTLCVGRVSAWASTPTASEHACCPAPKGTAPAPTLTACCPIAAAVVSPRLPYAPVVSAAFAASPRLPPSRELAFIVAAPTAPPEPTYYLTPGSARAPPLT